MVPMRACTRHLSFLQRGQAHVRGFASATFFGLLLVGLVVGCGGGGSSSSGGNPTPSSTTSTVIGPAGGVAATPDGTITIIVPAGAVASNTAITIAPSTANVPQGNIGAVLDLGPDGTQFNTPITISVKYDPTLIPQGVTESSLTLAFLSAGSTWTEIPTTVDTVNKLLNGQTTHFTHYASMPAKATRSPYGSLIGNFNGVNVYSNGCSDPSKPTDDCLTINNQATIQDTDNKNNPRGYNSGIQWQCVEFVNRYYNQYYGKDIRLPLPGPGNAKDYYNLASDKGLVAIPNDGSAPPQIGDIIVSESSPYGHVAIVQEVSDKYIKVVQQNWFNGPGDLGYPLEKTGNKVDGFSSAYPVRGWLRKPQVPLTAPTGINATAGNGQATISWNAVSGASSYNLYMASVTGVTKNNYISLTSGVKGTGVTSPFIQTGLPNGTAHYFVVTAINANGESSESSQVSATPQAGIPIVYQPSNDIGVQDIWTTSIYSYAPGGGGPGGGLNDERLRVGGSSDLYYSLIQFDLSQLPPVGLKVELQLYMPQVTGAGTTGLYVDRVTAFWDWRTQGTGQDRLRLWWANRPSAIQWIPNSLPAPIAGQWYVIDITTLYNAWQAGTYPNYGVQLRPVTNSNTWADFSSSNSVDALHHPRLVVTTITTTLPAGYVVQGGLTWMPVTFDLNWTNANAYCANTTINGQTGWRLPTQAEANAFSSSFGSIGGFYNPLWASPSMPSIWTSTPASGGSHYFANILTGFGFDVFDVNLLGVPCVR